MQGGVILTIVPLLSLGADQTAKLQCLVDANQLPVDIYHLDEYRSVDVNQSLCRLLNALTDSSVTVFLFSSPQKLLSREWSRCLEALVKRGSVPLTVCIDECHLYAQFGAEFRAEFHAMKGCLFGPIIQYRPTTPILFLTATASTTVLEDLEELTGLSFDRTELLWSASPSSVARRQVYMDIHPRESPLAPFKAEIRRRYGRPSGHSEAGVVPKQKLIFYSNSRKRLMRYKELICTFLDEEAYSFDAIIVHGELFREQKFHNIETFCMQHDLSTIDAVTGKTISFVPRILFSTAGVAGAGLDNSDVRSVHRDGYPPTLLDYIQEGGRPARYPGALSSDNRYHVNISWQSFCSLLFRIYIVPVIEAERKEADRIENERQAHELQAQHGSTRISTANLSQQSLQAPSIPSAGAMAASTLLLCDQLAARQYSNLLSVLKVIHLYPGCLHNKLEQACVNPFVATCHQPLPCGDACFYCSNAPARKTIYQPVVRSGLSSLLIDLFIKNPGPVDSWLVHSIYTTLSTYVQPETGAGFNQLVFSSDRKTIKVQEIQLVLLQLFAAHILEPRLIGKKLCCALTTDASGNPNVNHDDFWAGMTLLQA
jgi:hypothetical protein